MAREFIVPGQIITGSGALTMAEETLKGLGKKALIVTDKVMIQLGNCAKVETALKNQGIDYAIYSEIVGELHPQAVAPGFQMYTCWMIRHIDGNPWLQTDRCEDERYTWLHDAEI